MIVGHSLGSVVGYDTLNGLLTEDRLVDNLHVLKRTALFLTFGSPLDKTAFIFRTRAADAEGREALAAAVQPMIGNDSLKRPKWINIFSRHDPISGRLDYYDDRSTPNDREVLNLEDSEAAIPLIAHTQYWGNDLLTKALFEGCAASHSR